jgi:hypothetical protein
MDEPPRNPLEKLTFAGRLLIIVTAFLFGCLFYYYYMYLAEHLPPGHYMLILFWLPIAIGAVIFFFFTAWILERCGVRIYR